MIAAQRSILYRSPPHRLKLHRSSLCLLIIAAISTVASAQDQTATSERPNILWLSSEDNGPHLGAYGDNLRQYSAPRRSGETGNALHPGMVQRSGVRASSLDDHLWALSHGDRRATHEESHPPA